MTVFTLCRFYVARFRAAISGCSEPHSASGMSTTAVSLRYRIEMVEKDLGTLSQTLLENFLKEVFKTFKNFKQGDFCPFLFVAQILNVAVFRAANSGCYEPNPVERDLDSCRFSPLPDRNGSG